ncbi:peptidase dimerization domain-containing protein [Candidatus Woesearchaeota archaeon]|nr:peptidase dimerization domain-containing protein [Candidatus Woesearchaeota archaeon]
MALEAIASGKIKKPSHVFVSDTEFKEGHPTLLTTLRGLIRATVGLKLSDKAVHSGIAGGVAFNPGRVLSDVLGTLADPYLASSWNVHIPGFYDGVIIRGADREAIHKTARKLSPAEFMNALGMHVQAENDRVEHLIRSGLLPTFEYNLCKGGAAGTSIPASAEAFVSMRLVDGQDPKKIEQAFLKALDDAYRGRAPENLYGGVQRVDKLEGIPCRIEVVFNDSTPAFRTRYDTGFHETALNSYRRFFDKQPVVMFEGGTIGTLPILQEAFGKDLPFVLFAQSFDTDGYHAEGEHYQLAHAKRAISAVADYFANL